MKATITKVQEKLRNQAPCHKIDGSELKDVDHLLIDENGIHVHYIDGQEGFLRTKGQDEVDLQDWETITITLQQEYLKVSM